MSGYEPVEWTAFGLGVAGATAALTGLLFVAVSINLTRILAFPELPGLAGAALVQLTSALFAAVFLLVPQNAGVLGAELAVLGFVVAFILVPVQLRQRGGSFVPEVAWWVTRALPTVLVPLLLLLAGIGVAQQVFGGLYLMAVAVLVSVAAALGYAWILLVEIQR
jgi:modulator of FtsH protease